jgi:hypothetical protein
MYLLLLFIVLAIAYLSDFFYYYAKADFSYDQTNNIVLIEYLTKEKFKAKDYSKYPKGFSQYNKKLTGKLIDDRAAFRYEYPLIDGHGGVFETTFLPTDISRQVDYYGLKDHLIHKSENGFSLRSDLSKSDYMANMNTDGWYFKSYSDFGVNYRELAYRFSSFTQPIAQKIYNDLHALGKDSYFNRVQATLNFVQFIPYGRPEYDAPGWYYHELAVPPECFIMGYGDCDTKSLFFVSILLHLIPPENMVLVNCVVDATSTSEGGNHCMAAVSNLGIHNENIIFENKKYVLIETTQPCQIGAANWKSFEAKEIIGLA